MDGRMFRRWCLGGCLLAASIGCNRNAKQQTLVGPTMPDSGTKLVNMPLPGTSKSLWGGSKAPAASVPVEVAAPISNKPASADALAALADVQVEAAFSERTVAGSKEGLLDSARKGYQKALKQEPKNKAALLGMAHYYARLGEREKAVEMYKKYLTIYPKDANAAHEVALEHARWHDFAGSVAWCEFALKIDPENRTVKKTMGFCQAFAGQWDEAFATLCQIMPEAQARHNLAGILDQMGHTDACKIQLQLALKADPNYAPSAGFLTELNKPRENPIQAAGGTEPQE